MLGHGRYAAMAAAFLAACNNGPGDLAPSRASEPAMTQTEQVAELRRQTRLISEELQSIRGGVSVLATVDRGGGSLFESSPGAIEIGRGFFTIDAKLEDGAAVTVYVADDVVVATGALIQVVAGQHGHYFRSFGSDVAP
jgi:hypothetical protein